MLIFGSVAFFSLKEKDPVSGNQESKDEAVGICGVIISVFLLLPKRKFGRETIQTLGWLHRERGLIDQYNNG